MEETYEKLRRFLNACDELVEGNYMSAERKISDVLRAIASSDALTQIFSHVTSDFDYIAAKRRYLRAPSGGSVRGEAFLPTARNEILAFVFCLLVEFDGGSMNFSDFLIRYFYEDGSYTASYAHFAGRMIRPFRDIVRDCFPAYGREGTLESESLRKRQGDLLGEISERATVERARIASALGGSDRRAAEIILGEVLSAIGRGDATAVKALLLGYRYLLKSAGAGEEACGALFAAADQL